MPSRGEPNAENKPLEGEPPQRVQAHMVIILHTPTYDAPRAKLKRPAPLHTARRAGNRRSRNCSLLPPAGRSW